MKGLIKFYLIEEIDLVLLINCPITNKISLVHYYKYCEYVGVLYYIKRYKDGITCFHKTQLNLAEWGTSIAHQ